MKNNSNFLKEIEFDIVFSHIEYLEGENGYQRVQKMEKIELTKGYIIGSSYKYDGIYYEGYRYDSPDGIEVESGELTNRKAINYWIVAVDMKNQHLVPKEAVEEWRLQSHYNIPEE